MTRQDIIALKAKHKPKTIEPLRCCASCEYLTDSGKCGRYDEDVPHAFLEQRNECPGYCPAVPF